jgi:hypothetical protein
MAFLDLPHLERARRIHELGFAVEIWDWTTKDVDALAATGARVMSMTRWRISGTWGWSGSRGGPVATRGWRWSGSARPSGSDERSSDWGCRSTQTLS